MVDNYSSHKHLKAKVWLAARPRWHMHFIPTYSSWLNQAERFLGLVTDKAIRRGSFWSVRQLIQRIDQFTTHYNQNCKPFKWTATPDSILARLKRLRERISGTGHLVSCVGNPRQAFNLRGGFLRVWRRFRHFVADAVALAFGKVSTILRLRTLVSAASARSRDALIYINRHERLCVDHASLVIRTLEPGRIPGAPQFRAS
jgi:hypothetical protein